MDTAKIVAVMLTNSGDLEEYLALNDKEIIKEPLPTIMIPTTSGTGSEASNTAVVIDEKGRKTWMTGSKLLGKPGGCYIFSETSNPMTWSILTEKHIANYKAFIETGVRLASYD